MMFILLKCCKYALSLFQSVWPNAVESKLHYLLPTMNIPIKFQFCSLYWVMTTLLLNCCVTLWCLTSWSWRIGIFLKSRVTWSTFPLHLRVRRLCSGIGNIGAPWANGIYSPEKWIARCEVANNMHYMKPLTIVVNTE